MNAIEFSHVTKIYKKGFFAIKVPALVDCSFSVASGSITGFVGPNGAGKTTAIKMIMGLVRADSGVIKVLGKDPGDPDCRRNIAFISEQPYFYNHLTVGETLMFAARLFGRNCADLRRDIDAALTRVGLQGFEKRKIKDLSKGTQQRCAMAQALLIQSTTLVLDEPLSGMDPPGRTMFRSILLSLARQGVTIFFSTHILDDIELLCQNVVVLSRGRSEYEGPIAGLLDRGFQGTDITMADCDTQSIEELTRLGCEITRAGGGKIKVFVPAGKDVLQCQCLLLDRKIMCDTVSRRTVPLEEVLYKPLSDVNLCAPFMK
jgi:ABC-2 type transport system ATP-binding protein